MEWYQILSLVVSAVVSILTLLGFGTVTKFYWEDKHKKKLEETEEVKKRKKEERHKEITDAVSEIFDPYSDKIVGAINKIEERLDLAKRCDLAELRNSLMNIYYNCAYSSPIISDFNSACGSLVMMLSMENRAIFFSG